MPTSPRQTIGRPHTAPPWGLSEPTTPAQQSGEISTLRPRTRTEMLSLRREELQLLARGCQEKALREEAEGAATEIRPHWGEGVDWWTLADGYRENAFEAFVSSPRFERYLRKRRKARAAEGPDPFGTHQVRVKRPSTSFAEKISRSRPPPPDSEVYFAPKRTIKHFTDEIFTWKARMASPANLDQLGKNKRYQHDECEPPYSSLSSTLTACSLDRKKGRNRRRPSSQMKKGPHAPYPLGKLDASEVARRAMEKSLARRDALKCAVANVRTAPPTAVDTLEFQNDAMSDVDSTTCVSSADTASRRGGLQPAELPYSKRGNEAVREAWVKAQLQPLCIPIPLESKWSRYGRLCGQS